MTFPILGGNGAVAGYSIDNSLRFNDNDSPYLSKSFSTVTNTKKFTVSFWFKPSAIPQSNYSGFLDVGGDNAFALISNSRILFFEQGGNAFYWQPTMLFRDSSAWYHFVLACDSTLATQTDRVKIYVNGVLQTDYVNNSGPSQNYDFGINTTGNTRYIGRKLTTSSYYDGYLAEFYQIDGQQLSATDFGEFDENSGIWKPIEYTGTFGSAGYYLDFENSGSLGTDQSGNGNNFTPTNLTSTDQSTDTPTNNFATWNSLDKDLSIPPTLSEGNTRLSQPPSGLSSNSNFGVPSGKWYFECKMTTLNNAWLGIVPQNLHRAGSNLFVANYTIGIYAANPNLYKNGSLQGSLGGGLSSGDIVMIAFDIDNGNFYVGKNGLWNDGLGGGFDQADFSNATAHTFTVKTGDNYVVGTVNGSGSSNYVLDINFGNPSFSISSGNTDDNGYGNFEYAPPTGFLALCTQNLATALSPTIDDGSQYFNTVLYTGNGSTNAITGVGFQPDWVWGKCRIAAQQHRLFDSSRGVLKNIISSAANTEATTANSLTSFDSDGFTLGSDDNLNFNTRTFVAWNWKANAGTTSSNTDGSITSTVQANTTAGFSIVTYTGVSASSGTFGHGLGKQCDMVIIKNRTNPNSWVVQHKDLSGSTYNLNLNGSGAEFNDGSFGITGRSSTTISVGSGNGVNGNGYNYVAYCFAEIEGYSKFGKYTGNGSADGTFVYTGFRPAWVMTKGASTAQVWSMRDNKRDSYNSAQKAIYANLSNAESDNANNSIDLLSNGFKIRNLFGTENSSGQTYIYMAFAENPFVTSSATPVTAR